jgi:molybdopterin synthase catalytic subunit
MKKKQTLSSKRKKQTSAEGFEILNDRIDFLKGQVQFWKNKYIDVLEKYNVMLWKDYESCKEKNKEGV